MKEKKKFSFKRIIVDNSKFLFASFIGAIIGSAVVGYAANIIYSGSQVGYDNSTSRLNSNDVQGALDELFSVADISDRVTSAETSITSLGTRVSTLESRITNTSVVPDLISVPSGTNTVVATVTLPAGGKAYSISGTAKFKNNSTGYRRVFLAYDNACDNGVGIAWDRAVPTVNGTWTVIGFTAPLGAGATGKNLYLCAYQNSGSAVDTYGRLYVVKF